jgi:DNA-directed RNA polymerase subunit RPC12/RpoP
MTSAIPTFRRFGSQADDLAVDLSAPDRPVVISELLARCAQSTPPEALWDLPVSRRIEWLLALGALDGLAEIDAEFRCGRCGQTLEITFTVDELMASAREADKETVEVGGRSFRRPTGRDQLLWMRQSYSSEQEACASLAESLALDGKTVDPAMLPEIEAALDDVDPLLRAPVEAACPDCGHAAEYEIDVAGFALARFRQAQENLIESVHRLASRYHWSERDILAMPEWRRERYLELLAREVH